MRKLWIGLAVVGLLLAGCGKKTSDVETVVEPSPDAVPSENASDAMPSMSPEEHAKMGDMGQMHEGQSDEGGDKAGLCPIQHNPITGKTAYADYNGKRYFFCCSDCPTEFLKHPDETIAEHPDWAAKWSEDIPD